MEIKLVLNELIERVVKNVETSEETDSDDDDFYVQHRHGCCCSECDTSDRHNWGYNSDGEFVHYDTDLELKKRKRILEERTNSFEIPLKRQRSSSMDTQYGTDPDEDEEMKLFELENMDGYPCGECGISMGIEEYSQLCGGHYCMNSESI